jgi:hypothetical protein
MLVFTSTRREGTAARETAVAGGASGFPGVALDLDLSPRQKRMTLGARRLQWSGDPTLTDDDMVSYRIIDTAPY